jgi:hypothetical protein
MRELGDRLGLAKEPGAGLGRSMGAGQDHLERAGAIQPDLPSLVNHAHAAAAQLAEELIAGDGEDGAPGLDGWGIAAGDCGPGLLEHTDVRLGTQGRPLATPARRPRSGSVGDSRLGVRGESRSVTTGRGRGGATVRVGSSPEVGWSIEGNLLIRGRDLTSG